MMSAPLTALLLFAGITVLLVVIFWPRTGILARVRKVKLNSRRVLLEDALKHLHDCEYKGITPSRMSVAGSLQMSTDDATELLGRLATLGLVTPDGEKVSLTSNGREYALRVIRMHRLWERYLADKTGVRETDWHTEAEWQEHFLTTDEANDLAAELGNPRFDPHGDPIPTQGGDLPRNAGRPLASMPPGERARILHIEDEPRSIYRLIVEEGLSVGVHVRMVSKTDGEISLEAEGRTIHLSAAAAANISVSFAVDEPEEAGTFATLADLRPGEGGKVLSISRRCRGLQRRRLMDLGIIPGTVIMAEFRSPGGDPTAYSVRGATIALRSSQAALIRIVPETER
jgi:DtxR family Mn-dependent transcriptional regulator